MRILLISKLRLLTKIGSKLLLSPRMDCAISLTWDFTEDVDDKVPIHKLFAEAEKGYFLDNYPSFLPSSDGTVLLMYSPAKRKNMHKTVVGASISEE